MGAGRGGGSLDLPQVKKTMNRFLFSLALIAVLSMNALSAPVMFQSGPGTALLELYTSEGCNSCPPAETWLSGLKESPGLWRDFVPVAFHVDYWDDLGWRDAWGTPAYTERQRLYAAEWHSESVYTPGLVLNGREWRDWSASTDGPKHSESPGGVLAVSSPDTNHWQISFKPAHDDVAAFEVHAAMLAGDLTSDVKAGENKGRRLKHDFAALNLLHASLVRSAESAHGEFVLPAPPMTAGSSLALAVWVTRAGQLEPLQAAGGWLVRPASSH